jgi:hypothetical protein
MAFSDARNEAARAETGRNATNHGDYDHAGAAQRNTNAMAARNSVRGLGFDPRFNPRRRQNVTPSYELTPHNVVEALGMAPLGPMSAVGSMLGALGVPGFAPEFEGFTGNVMGPGDYDPTNRTGLMSRMKRRAGLQRGY